MSASVRRPNSGTEWIADYFSEMILRECGDICCGMFWRWFFKFVRTTSIGEIETDVFARIGRQVGLRLVLEHALDELPG